MEDTNALSQKPPQGVTAEDVMVILRENAQQIKKMGAETDRRMQETDRLLQETAQQMRENALQRQETDRQLKEMRAETDRLMQENARQFKEMSAETERQMKDTDRRIKETERIVGGLGNRFGDMAEQFLVPALRGKFREFGFTFGEIYRNIEWENESHDLFMEFDALLGNGSQAMVVEVKAKLDKADIDEQIVRMEKVRRYADLRGDTRQFYCAMAAMTAQKNVIAYALSNGFYLIMPSGEDVAVTKPISEPRFW
jgi:hypothetical protein